jgi:hypothetical protein
MLCLCSRCPNGWAGSKQDEDCHGTELITAKHYTNTEWNSVVGVMISYGANVPDSDIEVITTFLAKNYGKSNVAIRSGAKDQ